MTFPFPLFAKFSALKIAFYCGIIFLLLIIIKWWIGGVWNKPTGIYEGFTQDTAFILKQNGDIYDDFYVEIYDELTGAEKRANYDVEKIMEITKMNTETADILEIGCGTGVLLSKFKEKGCGCAMGIDKSPSMIAHKSPLLRNGDDMVAIMVADAMDDHTIFERAKFTHIVCLYMTIYEIADKMRFFRNAAYGLQPDGFLILHLVKGDSSVNPSDNFNGLINLGKPKALDETDIVNSGINKLETNFGGFLYKRDWSDIYSLKETFTDVQTQNVRQNEMEWFFEPVDVIVEQCKRCGFRLYDVVPEDISVGGFLYFFQKYGALRK
jgi:SAM-dependent methyltransferase